MFAGFCQSEGESFSCHRGGELGFIRCQLTTDALPHSTNDEILGTHNLLRNLSLIQVKETFGIGKQESSEFSTSTAKDGADVKNGARLHLERKSSNNMGILILLIHYLEN